MELNDLFNLVGARKKKVRVGRGIGSGKGKTSGRGVKGQKARSGVAIKGFEGGQMPIFKRLPKRGFSSRVKPKYQAVTLKQVYRLFDKTEVKETQVIDSQFLYDKNLITSVDANIKLIGVGGHNTKLEFRVNFCTNSAKSSVESFGGIVNLV